jgi:membrane protein
MLMNRDRESARLETMAGARPDGGCGAAAPSGIPPRGWRAVLRRTSLRAFENRLLGEAAAVAFYTLLALFPAMAALAWLCGLLADPAAAAERLRGVAFGALPAGAAEVAGELLGRFAARPGGGLGPGAGAAAIGTALWGGTAAAAQLFGALNAAYGERESRGLLRLHAVALLFALGAGTFIVLALAAIAVPAALGAQAGAGSGADTVLRLGRWPVLLVAVSVGLAVAYRYGPSRGCPRWRWVSWGSAFAALAWLLGSAAFSFYVARVGGYDRVYGSLGAVVGLMTWVWMSSAAVLFGAALNAELEREASGRTAGSDSASGLALPATR